LNFAVNNQTDSALGPRIVSSFSAQVSLLVRSVRTNLKTCLVGFVNKYDKEEFSLDYSLKLYLHMRIYHALKYYNRNILPNT
jgi:predicted transcriptional regulator with HTH domain